MMSRSKSEKALSDAIKRVKQLSQSLFRNGNVQELRDAQKEQTHWEREVAKEKNEQFAAPIEFPLEWDTGAPLPFIMANDNTLLLSFYLKRYDPDWDGTYVTITNPNDTKKEDLGLVEFLGCNAFLFGSPNDEVHKGHPLAGSGLEPYSAQEVFNSKWIKEVEKMNSVHESYAPERWKDLKHYIFWFHDSTLECIAKSFRTEVFKCSMQDLLLEMNQRMLR